MRFYSFIISTLLILSLLSALASADIVQTTSSGTQPLNWIGASGSSGDGTGHPTQAIISNLTNYERFDTVEIYWGTEAFESGETIWLQVFSVNASGGLGTLISEASALEPVANSLVNFSFSKEINMSLNTTYLLHFNHTRSPGADDYAYIKGSNTNVYAGQGYWCQVLSGVRNCNTQTGDMYFKIFTTEYTPASPPTDFFDLSVKSLVGAAVLNNATLVLSNGSIYTTFNGTFNTDINQSDGLVFNFTVSVDYYFNLSMLNFNTSVDLTVNLSKKPQFFVYNSWNGSQISDWSLGLNGSTYSDGGSGYVFVDLNMSTTASPVASNLSKSGYISRFNFSTITGASRLNLTPEAVNNVSMWMSEVNVSALIVLSNESFGTGWYLNTGSQNYSAVSFGGVGVVRLTLNKGNYTWSFISNSSVSPYHNLSSVPFEVSNDYHNLSFEGVHNYKLTLFAKNLFGGALIYNWSFTIVNATSDISYSFSKSMVSESNITLNITQGNDLFVNYSAVGFADWNATITNVSVLAFSAYLPFYTMNSLNLTFYDSFTLRRLNQSDGNITVEFSGVDDLTRYNDTGAMYVDLLTPSEYTLVFYNDKYRRGRYIVTVTNNSYQAIPLYLTSVNDSSLVLLLVKDKFGNNIQSAQITIQRYLNNSWVTEQIVASDWQGRAEGYFILSNVYYNFMVDLNSVRYFGEANSDANKKLIYAEDVSTGISFYLDLLRQSNVVQTVLSSLGVAYNSSFVSQTNNTGYFRFIYDDPANLVHVGCIDVFDGMPLGSSVKICNCSGTSVSSESSTITCSVNASVWGSGLFTMNAYIDGVLVDSYARRLFSGGDVRPDFGLLGYLLCFVAVVISFLVFINSPSIGLFVGTGVLTLFSVLGLAFKDVTFGVFIVLLVVSYLIGSIKSNSGVGD